MDIIYLTGDLPAHDIWNQTREGNEAAIRTSLIKLQSRFPNTPVYSSIGNHAPCFINELVTRPNKYLLPKYCFGRMTREKQGYRNIDLEALEAALFT